MTACDTSDQYFGTGGPDLPTRDVPYADARRETILLLLQLQQVLSDEFDVGAWEAPPLGGVNQVSESTANCVPGAVNELWMLGSAGPLSEETWPAAVARFEEILTPLGFGAPVDGTVVSDNPIAIFFNETTGAEVELRYNKASVVRANTGCVLGKASQDWPDGTEVVPEYLRTTGRALHHGEEETWAPYNPSPRDDN